MDYESSLDLSAASHNTSYPNKKYYSSYPNPITYPSKFNCAYEILEKNANLSKPAIYFSEGYWTYQELIEKVNKIANFLSKRKGIVPGDKTLLHGFNSPILAACWFAIIKIGAICITTCSQLREREISAIIEQAPPKLIISDIVAREEVLKASDSHLKETIFFNAKNHPNSLENLIKNEAAVLSAHISNANDTAIIAFTSGSTGKPKGTLHSHQDIMYICDCFPKDILKTSSEDIFCGNPPLAFTYGLGGMLLFPLRYRAATVLLDKLSPENLLKTIEKFKVTTVFSSPIGYRLMLEHYNKYNIGSLKKCVSAGEHLPAKTYLNWHEKTGLQIIDGIGSTEMLHIFISTPVDQIIPGSTGKPIPGYEAKIIDANGIEVSPGTVGFLAVRGPTGCRYIYPELQSSYVKDGWNITGDLFKKTEDGYYWFHSRADDTIITSGYSISGTEIEEVIMEYSGVKECAVVGVPDSIRGQIIKAHIRLTEHLGPSLENENNIKAFIKEKLAIYKCPHVINFVDDIPRNSTGKIQRFALKK